jgi:hypothetical protein
MAGQIMQERQRYGWTLRLFETMMRLSKVSRWIILAAGLPLLCCLVYLAFVHGPNDEPAPVYVQVAFLGYTNIQGNALPLFVVSNVTAVPIQCTSMGFQTEVTNVVRGRSTNRVWAWAPGWTSGFLQPGEGRIVTAPPPTNASSYCFAVFALKPLNFWQNGVEKLKPYLPATVYAEIRPNRRRIQFVQSRMFSGEKEETHR